MRKKSIKMISVIFICIAIIFVIYKIDTINETKERMVKVAKYLMNSISAEDYEEIRLNVKKTDGTELSNQELANFLLNTGLYRAMFINTDEPSFTYSTNVNFFNTNKGAISFSYKALDGDLITNELEYYDAGINEYFITNDIKESDKEIKRYPLAKDLANGKDIDYKEDIDEDIIFFKYKMIQDANKDFYLEIFEESKEDIKISMFNMLDENFKNIENKYKYKWNDDCSIVSVYFNSINEPAFVKNLFISTTSMLCSTTIQALNGNPDWHLTINYYDYNTKKLLKTEKIR